MKMKNNLLACNETIWFKKKLFSHQGRHIASQVEIKVFLRLKVNGHNCDCSFLILVTENMLYQEVNRSSC